MLSEPFDVYLNDHLAMLVAERELCQRVQRSNEGSPLADAAGRQLGLARAGEAAVKQLLADRGAAASGTKATMAWLAEKAGRLKLNGQLTGYSPASRVLEVEGLILAAQARGALWQCLAASQTPPPEAVDWGQLQQQAEAQLADLRAVHSAVAAESFGVGGDRPAGIHH